MKTLQQNIEKYERYIENAKEYIESAKENIEDFEKFAKGKLSMINTLEEKRQELLEDLQESEEHLLHLENILAELREEEKQEMSQEPSILKINESSDVRKEIINGLKVVKEQCITPFKNIIATPTNYNGETEMYTLNYKSYFGNMTCSNMIHAFDKEVLEKLQEAMEEANKVINKEMKKHFKNIKFKYHTNYEILAMIEKLRFYDFELVNDSHLIHNLFVKKSKNKQHKIKCHVCNDSGCHSCEPHRFI